MSNNEEARPAAEHGEPLSDEGRREALRKLGKFTAYTAPALLVMLASDKAVAQESIPK